jgi:hypothetical protein
MPKMALVLQGYTPESRRPRRTKMVIYRLNGSVLNSS